MFHRQSVTHERIFLFVDILILISMDDVDDRLLRRFIIYLFVFSGILVYNLFGTHTFKVLPSFRDLHPVPLPNCIMEPFKHYNGTLLSPEGQDRRWQEYSDYYIRYQEELSKRSIEHYVVYTTTNSGLANKLNGLVSSLLIAMVTNRGLQRTIYLKGFFCS